MVALGFKGNFKVLLLLSFLPLLILQLASSSPFNSPPSLFDGFSFIVSSHKNCFMRVRREKGKSEEGRRKGAKEMGSNASILSTSSLKLLLSNAPFFSTICNIKVGQVSCVCEYVSIQACVGVYHCPAEQVAYTAIDIKRKCN